MLSWQCWFWLQIEIKKVEWNPLKKANLIKKVNRFPCVWYFLIEFEQSILNFSIKSEANFIDFIAISKNPDEKGGLKVNLIMIYVKI